MLSVITANAVAPSNHFTHLTDQSNVFSERLRATQVKFFRQGFFGGKKTVIGAPIAPPRLKLIQEAQCLVVVNIPNLVGRGKSLEGGSSVTA